MRRKLIKKGKKKKRGFTLIELLAVILILGIIALIAIPTVNSVIRQARIGATESSASNLISAAEQKCQLAMMNGEKFSGYYDISELSDVVKGSEDFKGYFEVSNICEVQLVLVADNLQDFCYKKSFDDDKVVHYEMEQGETCLLEQKKPSELDCFEYESNGGEITITGYKCGGIITDWSFFDPASLAAGNAVDIPYEPGINMDVVIPGYIDGKKVTKIADSAFSNMEKLDPNLPFSETNVKVVPTKNVIINSLVIPNTVREIGENAFALNKISEITLSYGVEKIGQASFLFNDINRLFMPNSIKELGIMAFAVNQNLKQISISNGLKEIITYAFASSGLEGTLVLPDSIEKIGEFSFSGTNINSIIFGKNIKSIDTNAFAGSKIQSLVIPDSVTSLGLGAFYENNITSLTIGSGLTSISQGAFSHNKLTSITIPNNIVSLGEGAFSDNNISKINYGNNLKEIGEGAFMNNKLSGTITIPDSVEKIGLRAYEDNDISTLIIGKNVKEIDAAAFFVGYDKNSNKSLTKIVNKTGRSFNWGKILFWWGSTDVSETRTVRYDSNSPVITISKE